MDLINKIIQGDSIEVMKNMPDNSFEFCFADPPYFMQIKNGKKLYRVEGTEFKGCDDDWDKFDSMEEYKSWTKKWLSQVHRLLKPNGSICLISGMQSIYEIGSILRELGFWVINDIIWQKSNPTPNFGGTRLNNSHETLIWASKSKESKFTFNYKTGKHLNEGKQMGSIWTFPVCSGNERLKDENNNKVHNTQKPEALLYRILTLFTNKGDLILDPFGGTMTTAAVAKKIGRNFTMIEKDETYIKYGKQRIELVVPEINEVENAIYDIKPAKVSFNEMVDNRYFIIGETFFHKNGEKATLISNKGILSYQNTNGSMHEIAAKMMNKTRRVNAFDFLYVLRKNNLISINEIRNEYRKKYKS
ncbi:DNA-methyltransferase [Mycoplasmopsis primatum]|uniref:DNA-methyltransferase n=1 Tax=Mycoplasmopsis primatum TaxID=55604 RepID=UPI00049838DF|nr:site-specific DNA-methyltransferase [Mycoplasmopsis primatum]